MIGGSSFLGIQWKESAVSNAGNTVKVDYDARFGSSLCIRLMTVDAQVQGVAGFRLEGIPTGVVELELPFTAKPRGFLAGTLASSVGLEVTYAASCTAPNIGPRRYAVARLGDDASHKDLVFITRALDDQPQISFSNPSVKGVCGGLKDAQRIGLDTICSLDKLVKGDLSGQIEFTDSSGEPNGQIAFKVDIP
ncbi:hypothetical protein ASG68_25480 [Rhizobium sp. Leaf453]|nr:hypothetical protein ASG68_25480 [Rhizobium sp. Leaf453]